MPVAGGIVLLTLGMNAIKEIDRREGIAVVEPGVVLGDLHTAVEAEGWFYPPDPNSLANCAIGGNLAENAGGPRAFKYGVTRDYVLGGALRSGVSGCALASADQEMTGTIECAALGSDGTIAVSGRRLELIRPEAARRAALFPCARRRRVRRTQTGPAGQAPRELSMRTSMPCARR